MSLSDTVLEMSSDISALSETKQADDTNNSHETAVATTTSSTTLTGPRTIISQCRRHQRRAITTAMKREICMYKLQHTNASLREIAAHFNVLWSMPLTNYTVRYIVRASDKWLSTDIAFNEEQNEHDEQIDQDEQNEQFEQDEPEQNTKPHKKSSRKQLRSTQKPVMSEVRNNDTLPAEREPVTYVASDLTSDMKREVCLYKMNCPRASLRDIADYFSKKWSICLTNYNIRYIVRQSHRWIRLPETEVDSGPQLIACGAKILKEQITMDMKREICLYKTCNPEATNLDIAVHFNIKWSFPLSEHNIKSILRHRDHWLRSTIGDFMEQGEYQEATKTENPCLYPGNDPVESNEIHSASTEMRPRTLGCGDLGGEDDQLDLPEMSKAMSQGSLYGKMMAAIEPAILKNDLEPTDDPEPVSDPYHIQPGDHQEPSGGKKHKEVYQTQDSTSQPSENTYDTHHDQDDERDMISRNDALKGLLMAISYLASHDIYPHHITQLWNILRSLCEVSEYVTHDSLTSESNQQCMDMDQGSKSGEPVKHPIGNLSRNRDQLESPCIKIEQNSVNHEDSLDRDECEESDGAVEELYDEEDQGESSDGGSETEYEDTHDTRLCDKARDITYKEILKTEKNLDVIAYSASNPKDDGSPGETQKANSVESLRSPDSRVRKVDKDNCPEVLKPKRSPRLVSRISSNTESVTQEISPLPEKPVRKRGRPRKSELISLKAKKIKISHSLVKKKKSSRSSGTSHFKPKLELHELSPAKKRATSSLAWRQFCDSTNRCGVFTTGTLSRGLMFGPYDGASRNPWEGADHVGPTPSTMDWSTTSWMAYVHCHDSHITPGDQVNQAGQSNESGHSIVAAPVGQESGTSVLNTELQTSVGSGANMEVSRVRGQVYYITSRDIPADTELVLTVSDQYKKRKEPRTFQCQLCGKQFRYPWALRYHERIHTGEKPHACPYCERAFARPANLQNHVRSHTQYRPFLCQECGKTFMQRADLRKHMRVHTGEKPYACDICFQRYSQSCQVVRHRRIHTGEKPYSCPYCSRCFSDTSTLRKHKKRCQRNETNTLPTEMLSGSWQSMGHMAMQGHS